MNQKPVICRFCRTDLRLEYGTTAPRCNAPAKLENKDLLKLHQNKDAKYVATVDCLTDLWKPLENKASIPGTFCLTCAQLVRQIGVKIAGFGVKGTNVGTMVACYILNETRYGPLHVMSLPQGILLIWPLCFLIRKTSSKIFAQNSKNK